jgi:hypothetical protein
MTALICYANVQAFTEVQTWQPKGSTLFGMETTDGAGGGTIGSGYGAVVGADGTATATAASESALNPL